MAVYTDEEIAEMYALYGSQEQRLNRLYYIMDRNGKPVKFRMNDAQRRLWEDMHFRNIIPKARQLGMTTFIQIWMLDQVLFTPNLRAGVIAHNQADAEKFFNDKIKYAYDRLPEELLEHRKPLTDSKSELIFANNSSIRVGTSHRSGTLQLLHVSEYGKLCAKFPDRAKEVRTGALPTVPNHGYVFIESTSEGRTGDFADKCKQAEKLRLASTPLSPLDYKMHFFPWWQEKSYVLPPESAVIPTRLEEYFHKLESKIGRDITPEQRAWYAKKEQEQGDAMKQEYPSTLEECFEESKDGTYYWRQMADMRKQDRITHVPPMQGYPVHTFWDIGSNDLMVCILAQIVGTQVRVIGYKHASGEDVAYFAKWLDEYAQERSLYYGTHYLPHDANSRYPGSKESFRETAEPVLKSIEVVPRIDSVEKTGVMAVRQFMPYCFIDQKQCEPLINALDEYSKKWNASTGDWSGPKHNWASHPADAFRTMAVVLLAQLEGGGYSGLDVDDPLGNMGMAGLHNRYDHESLPAEAQDFPM